MQSRARRNSAGGKNSRCNRGSACWCAAGRRVEGRTVHERRMIVRSKGHGNPTEGSARRNGQTRAAAGWSSATSAAMAFFFSSFRGKKRWPGYAALVAAQVHPEISGRRCRLPKPPCFGGDDQLQPQLPGSRPAALLLEQLERAWTHFSGSKSARARIAPRPPTASAG